jgi:hypothetical protein
LPNKQHCFILTLAVLSLDAKMYRGAIMPIIHRYVESNGYYIKSSFKGTIVTYQVTKEGEDYLQSHELDDGDEISAQALLWMQKQGYIYTGGSGPGQIEPSEPIAGNRKITEDTIDGRTNSKPRWTLKKIVLGIIIVWGIVTLCCFWAVLSSEPEPDDISEDQQQAEITYTPTPILTTTVEATATSTPAPTATDTSTPTSTPSPTPTPTPAPAALLTTVSEANVRSGPGTEYPIVWTTEAGQTIGAYARTESGWYQIDFSGEAWIAGSLVNLQESQSEIPLALTIPPTPTATFTPTSTRTPNLTATAQVFARQTTIAQQTQTVLDATATIEAYVNSAPVGAWCANNNTRRVCVADFRYTQRAGATNAPSNGRFIAFAVGVQNISNSNISANPGHLSLVMEDGRTFEYASQTFSYWSVPLRHTTIAPGDNVQGGLVFLVPNDVAPRRLIYRGGLFESEIQIDLYDPPVSQE